MTSVQELRRHLRDEHDVDERTMRSVGIKWLHEEHAIKHDRRGSIYHTSHKGLDVVIADAEQQRVPTPNPQDVQTSYYCSSTLHDGDKRIHAAWFVQEAEPVSKSSKTAFARSPLVAAPHGSAAAVCDEHLADGIRYVTRQGARTVRVIVRRENVDTTRVAESVL